MSKELNKILTQHYKMYPLMEPRDFVKLIYQNEFGNTHFFTNRMECRNFIEHELSLTEHLEEDLYIPIGNGYCRLNLFTAKEKGIYIDKIVDLIGKNQNCEKGTLVNFKKKLEVLKKFYKENMDQKKNEQLNSFLKEYEKNEYPSVHHSLTYRKTYYPHYRLVLLEDAEKLK